MTRFWILLGAVLICPLACGGDTGGDTDSDTGSETEEGSESESAGPETDEEKTLRLTQEYFDAQRIVDETMCQCDSQGGMITYEECIAQLDMQDTPESRMCFSDAIQQYAGPEMIAYLECAFARTQAALPCYTEELCLENGSSGPVTECVVNNSQDHMCQWPEGFIEDWTAQCG